MKFGVIGDNAPSLGIQKGRIVLSNQDLKPIFDAVVETIVASCSRIIVDQRAEVRQYSSLLYTLNAVQCVLLVGGFAESPYLRRILSQKLSSYNYDVQMIIVGDYA